MSDDADIFGTDTARYQPLGTYGPGAFEVINSQDPQLFDKLERNVREGRPSGVYLWVYAGHDLFADAAGMIDAVRARLGRDPELGYWADYEDVGIAEWQLHDYFRALDARSASGGYYSGPFAVDHSQFMDRQWWNAAYPTNGPGFPGYGALWASSRPRPMKVWQFTSFGGLDQDVITEDAWYYQQVHGGTPAPQPPPQPEAEPESEDMIEATFNGKVWHFWAHAGVIRARVWASWANPGGVITVPPAHDEVKVDMDNPRGLVMKTLSDPIVLFAGADGNQLEIVMTGFGPSYRVI